MQDGWLCTFIYWILDKQFNQWINDWPYLIFGMMIMRLYCDDYLCRRADEAENVPISLDLNNVKHKREESLLQIRTNPPSPQCFSATRGPTKTTPSKASKSRMMVCTTFWVLALFLLSFNIGFKSIMKNMIRRRHI